MPQLSSKVQVKNNVSNYKKSYGIQQWENIILYSPIYKTKHVVKHKYHTHEPKRTNRLQAPGLGNAHTIVLQRIKSNKQEAISFVSNRIQREKANV